MKKVRSKRKEVEWVTTGSGFPEGDVLYRIGMTYRNPNMGRYSSLVVGKDRTYLGTPYSDLLVRSGERYDILSRRLSRDLPLTPLVDVGAGCNSWTVMSNQAELHKASMYIGIDLDFHVSQSLEGIEMPRHLVKEDMLLALARLNSASFNFVFNGIDWIYGEYGKAIVEEIKRACKPKGVVFGRGSEPLVDMLRDDSAFKREDKPYLDYFYFKRK